jgi:hypothetical protein
VISQKQNEEFYERVKGYKDIKQEVIQLHRQKELENEFRQANNYSQR